MKTYGNIILTAAVIFWVFMALRPASAHLIRMHEFAATGQHWCLVNRQDLHPVA